MVYANGTDLDVYDSQGKSVREAEVDRKLYECHDTTQGKILIAKDATEATSEDVIETYRTSPSQSREENQE